MNNLDKLQEAVKETLGIDIFDAPTLDLEYAYAVRDSQSLVL